MEGFLFPRMATVLSTSPPVEPPGPEPVVLSHPGRWVSLDAYRGLVMFTLLLGGVFHSLKGVSGWDWLYRQNEHVAWAGCVYWDLIQPAFMFLVGAAIPLARARRAALGESVARQWRHAALRAFHLVALGIFLDHVGAERIQIGFIRVLQQIAPGYLLGFLLAGRGLRRQALVAAAGLAGYHLLWVFNPWNGPGGPWAMGHENLGGAFDRWMLGRNYSGYYVGLNAVPSAITILFGVMAGEWVQGSRPGSRTLGGLLAAGLAGVVAGWAVSPWMPLIKRIWTPSFAVFAGGWTTLMLAGFYWLVEVRGCRRAVFPLVVVGMNSTAAYVLGNAFGGWFRSASGAWIGWLRGPLGEVGFPILQRVAFAVAAWAVLHWLHRRRIFFKL